MPTDLLPSLRLFLPVVAASECALAIFVARSVCQVVQIVRAGCVVIDSGAKPLWGKLASTKLDLEGEADALRNGLHHISVLCPGRIYASRNGQKEVVHERERFKLPSEQFAVAEAELHLQYCKVASLKEKDPLLGVDDSGRHVRVVSDLHTMRVRGGASNERRHTHFVTIKVFDEQAWAIGERVMSRAAPRNASTVNKPRFREEKNQ